MSCWQNQETLRSSLWIDVFIDSGCAVISIWLAWCGGISFMHALYVGSESLWSQDMEVSVWSLADVCVAWNFTCTPNAQGYLKIGCGVLTQRHSTLLGSGRQLPCSRQCIVCVRFDAQHICPTYHNSALHALHASHMCNILRQGRMGATLVAASACIRDTFCPRLVVKHSRFNMLSKPWSFEFLHA